MSVGLGHAIALTKEGEVYGWGKNDYKQVCDSNETYIQQPVLLSDLKQQQICGVSCGPAQSFVWSDYSCSIPKPRIPFIVDLSEYTFRLVRNVARNTYSGINDSQTPGSAVGDYM